MSRIGENFKKRNEGLWRRNCNEEVEGGKSQRLMEKLQKESKRKARALRHKTSLRRDKSTT